MALVEDAITSTTLKLDVFSPMEVAEGSSITTMEAEAMAISVACVEEEIDVDTTEAS